MSRGPSNFPLPLVPSISREPVPGPMNGGMIYPGHGYPQNRGEDRPPGSPFGRLALGQCLGKSSILVYRGESSTPQAAPVDMITVEGDDLDAQQMVITLATPRVIPIAFDELPADQQNMTGEQSNAEVTVNNFPGDFAPIAWPPLDAIIEWGVRGAQAQAVVDYVNGMTFSVSASFLRVRAAVTQTFDPSGIDGTSAAYYLAAFVGPGTARAQNPQRTVYVGAVPSAADSAVFDVPKFAKRVTLRGGSNASPPPTLSAFVRFWQSPDGPASSTNVGNVLVAANQPGGFDVPAGAAYFSVYNQSGAELRMGAVFELALS